MRNFKARQRGPSLARFEVALFSRTSVQRPPQPLVFSPVHGACRGAVEARRSRRVVRAPRSSAAPFTGLLAVWLEPRSRAEAEAGPPGSPVNWAKTQVSQSSDPPCAAGLHRSAVSPVNGAENSCLRGFSHAPS